MWRTDYAVISLDLQTLKEKDLGIQHVPSTKFIPSKYAIYCSLMLQNLKEHVTKFIVV